MTLKERSFVGVHVERHFNLFLFFVVLFFQPPRAGIAWASCAVWYMRLSGVGLFLAKIIGESTIGFSLGCSRGHPPGRQAVFTNFSCLETAQRACTIQNWRR